MPRPPARPPLDAPAGLPPQWPWEATFLHALLRWAGALLWLPRQGQVTYAELALDFEEHAGRALPAAAGHRLAGPVPPLRERAHVLKLALDKTQQFLRAGELLGGQLRPLCNALVPFGGYKCMGRTERPVFACRPAMQEHMRRLEAHCRALWARRLARPGRGRQEAFLRNYLPRPLGGQASLRPFQRVRPQQPHCPPAQSPPPARPAGAPRALGRGLGTVRVLCPVHGAATCAACGATGQGIKYCCSLGHEGHRLAPAAQRAGARALRAWLQAPQQVPRPAPPPGTVLGSRGRESPRGSSEDEPPQARRRVLPPAVLGRRRRPPRVGSSSDDDEPPRRRPPLRAGPSLSHSSQDFSPHHTRGYGGGGAGDGGVGQPQPQSQPRATNLSGSGLISPGGRWLRAPPLAASSATTSLPPPPLQLLVRPAAGAGGRDRGAQALWTFLAPSRPRSLMRRGRMGLRVAHPHPRIASSKELQGGFGMGRVKVPPHPSVIRGSRMLQDRVWGSRVLQGRDWGSRMLQGRVWGSRMLQGRVWGSRMLQGRVWGSRVLQGSLGCRHRGSQRLLLWVTGVTDRARVRDRVVPPSPRHDAAPPPPFVGGQHGRRSAAVRLGGAGQRVGQSVRGAPRSAGVRQPVCRPTGGAVEPWLHSASAVIGRGGRPTPRSRTCTCGRGWGIAQPEVWAGSLLRGSHIGRRPGSFRRAGIRWGGGGGKGLIYLYTAVYR